MHGGVVDQDVETTEGRDTGVDGAADIGRRGDVGYERQHPGGVSVLCRQRRERVPIAVDEGDARAGFQELLGRREANASGGAGHERGAVVEGAGWS